ncbi:MAG: sulfatase-like hydrolase/transferase [Rhodobacteraceae bacterium]|nr:sulfatase-like hydrolase/transferase [Paracoccaceae bacterium]
MSKKPNILLITADQWRGDCLGVIGHPTIQTPTLDAFAKEATVFARHYSATAPCSPARASLYTGLLQSNTRVIGNGAPLDDRFDNIARAARRAGYVPTLFGYTDTSPDPRVHDRNDPAVTTYEGVLPGFAVGQSLPENDRPWYAWLKERNPDRPALEDIHKVEPESGEKVSLKSTCYSKDETQTAFLTDRFLSWASAQDQPWMAHISFLRPHPPLCVPAPYNTLYDPDDGPDFAGAETPEEEAAFHPMVAAIQQVMGASHHVLGCEGLVRDLSRRDLKRMRALYYGMITEVDAQLGRMFAGLKALGVDEDTIIIFTSDHAEMMGDHWMLGKGGFHEQSYHIPLMIRVPGKPSAGQVEAFTSSTDIFPTLLDLWGIEPKHSPDGRSLMPFLEGKQPDSWRQAAIWEFDFRELQAVLPQLVNKPDPDISPALMSSFGPYWHYVHIPAMEPILIASERVSAPKPNHASDPAYASVALEETGRLLSVRMRANEETLAKQPVWAYYGD